MIEITPVLKLMEKYRQIHERQGILKKVIPASKEMTASIPRIARTVKQKRIKPIEKFENKERKTERAWYPVEVRYRVYKLHDAGLTITEISNALQIKNITVRRWIETRITIK